MSDYTENETTAITLQPAQPNLARFGDRSELLVMFNRIRSMVPGAELAPDAIVWAAAQKAIAHGLDLFDDEIFLMEIRGKWQAHVGIRGLRRNADGKFYFEDSDDYPRRLSDEELKADMGSAYEAGCIGVEVRLYNLPKAREAKEIGIPYFPRKERGYYWPATDKKSVPNTRTPAWLAQKRAEKIALRAEFALKFQRDRDEEEIIAHLQRKLRDKDQAEAPIMRRQLTEDDRRMDAMLFDDEPPASQPDEIEDGDYRQPEPPDNGQHAEESPENPWNGDDAPAYITVRAALTGNCAKLAEWARQKHIESDGPASEAQYGYLTGTIDKHVEEGAHNAVLSVLCKSEISKTNMPGGKIAKLLLDATLKEKKGDDGIMLENPEYRQDVVACLNSIYRAMQGQQTLLEVA